ncbi:hypothetical protein ABZP36_018064 [Zizania latifolia]
MALNVLLMTLLTIAHKSRYGSLGHFSIYWYFSVYSTCHCLMPIFFRKKHTRFEYLEPNGKDVGLNVHRKAETVLAILDNREKLRQVREKAAAVRDKYFGLSSTGTVYKSSAASFGSGSYSSGSRYGSTGGSREVDSFKDSYTDIEWRKSNKETTLNYNSNRGGITSNQEHNNYAILLF